MLINNVEDKEQESQLFQSIINVDVHSKQYELRVALYVGKFKIVDNVLLKIMQTDTVHFHIRKQVVLELHRYGKYLNQYRSFFHHINQKDEED